MTDLDILNPDTGEIPRIPGEKQTVILRTDPGEATQNLSPYLLPTSPFGDRFRRPGADHDSVEDTLTFIGWPTGAELVVQEALRPAAPNPGPLPPTPVEPNPNPPAPRPSVPPQVHPRDLAAVQPIAPLERAAGADEVDRLRRSVPYVMPEGYRRRGWFSRGRHAAPGPLWLRVASWSGLALGIAVVLGTAATLAALAVIR